MLISNKNIDGGTPFDWGRTSSDYGKYRDIYPQLFMIKSWNAIYVQQDRKYSTWEQEHREFLKRKAPAEFDILHYGAIAELKKKFQEEESDESSET